MQPPGRIVTVSTDLVIDLSSSFEDEDLSMERPLLQLRQTSSRKKPIGFHLKDENFFLHLTK